MLLPHTAFRRILTGTTHTTVEHCSRRSARHPCCLSHPALVVASSPCCPKCSPPLARILSSMCYYYLHSFISPGSHILLLILITALMRLTPQPKLHGRYTSTLCLTKPLIHLLTSSIYHSPSPSSSIHIQPHPYSSLMDTFIHSFIFGSPTAGRSCYLLRMRKSPNTLLAFTFLNLSLLILYFSPFSIATFYLRSTYVAHHDLAHPFPYRLWTLLRRIAVRYSCVPWLLTFPCYTTSLSCCPPLPHHTMYCSIIYLVDCSFCRPHSALTSPFVLLSPSSNVDLSPIHLYAHPLFLVFLLYTGAL